MKPEELKNAFGPIPDACYQAMMAAARSVKEDTFPKKRISIALVALLILLLAAGAALALSSWREAARQIVETEQVSGYFEDWPAAQKTSLVKALVEQDYVEKTAEVTRLLSGTLPEEEAGHIADGVLTAFTGREVYDISFMEIMIAAWGPFEQWSKEEQAWYSQLMVDMGLQKDDHTLYVMPYGAVDEDAAIEIARREIAKGYGVEVQALEGYDIITSFQVPEFTSDPQAWWHIEWYASDALPESDRLFSWLSIFVHPETGALYESVESILEERRAHEAFLNDPLRLELKAFMDQYDLYRPQQLPLEAKAAWSQSLAPKVLARHAEDPDFFDLITVGFSMRTYGLPEAGSLSREEALALAQKALTGPLGRKEEELPFFLNEPDVYYDITDAAKPLWKFLFHAPHIYRSDEAMAYYGEDIRLPDYKVELDARTGELTAAYPIHFTDIHTAEDLARTM